MVSSEALDYRHDDLALTGWLARPTGAGPHPGVLVMHDALGMSGHVRAKAEELAAAGYIALASDMYGLGLAGGDTDECGKLFMGLQAAPQQLRDRVLATHEALRSVPDVDPVRIAAIGYCFGGQCVLELARSGADVASVVSFHGLLTSRIPARRGEVRAKVLAITGALDPHVPIATVEGFQNEMAHAEADWHLTVYGQGWHAFTDPKIGRRDDIPGVRYDALLDRLSWSQATEFLKATLGIA